MTAQVGLAGVRKVGGGLNTVYQVRRDGAVVKSYSVKDWPKLGMGGAKDLALTKARNLNIARSQAMERDR